MKKSLQIFLNLVGIVFILFGVAAIIQSFVESNPLQILWLCYASIIILGIGIIKKNGFLLLTQINIMFIPMVVWNIDLFYTFITNKPLLGITNYIFKYGGPFRLEFLISSQHLFAIPLSILLLYFIKIKRKDAWKWSSIEILSFFIFTRLFTPKILNINLAFGPFYESGISYLTYSISWMVGFIIVIFLTNLLFTRKLFLKK